MTLKEIEETTKLIPQFTKRGGILPVAVQESETGKILMLASVNEEAFNYTIKNRVATFFSTSNQKLWVKGQTSGNYLTVNDILIDCDQDAIIYKVSHTKGGVCHTFNKNGENRKACFYRKTSFKNNELKFIEE